MKLLLKNSLTLSLIACSLVMSSCGKKDNKVNSNPATNASGTSPFYSGGSGANYTAQVQSIKSNVSCLNGYRLTNDVSFFVNGGFVAANKIGGQFQTGYIPNGTISKMWVGVSLYRDIMFVTQVTNGSQVIGFNVTLSFCELKSNPATYPSIISNERVLKNFQAPYGIILDSNTYCGYSVVDLAANTYITSERNLSNPYSPPDAQVPTSFTKPTCNGQF